MITKASEETEDQNRTEVKKRKQNRIANERRKKARREQRKYDQKQGGMARTKEA